MRVTNNMILKNSANNINGTKTHVDKTNTQMTTQQKISRPSEDPVTAIRSLRLATTLSQVDQYYEKNIPDAESWLEVTETALQNMKKSITEFRTLCDYGATGTLTQDDRNTILTQLRSLQTQIFDEGNADYAGRTVFTGFRTDKSLTFTDADVDKLNTKYEITQEFNASEISEQRYYNNELTVPRTGTEVETTAGMGDIQRTTFNRIRLAYDNIADLSSVKVLTKDSGTGADTVTPFVPASGGGTLAVYETEAAWAEASTKNPKEKEVAAGTMVFIKETGDLILADDLAASFKSADARISVDYRRDGFSTGELRPEYYYNCTNVSDADSSKHIAYEKYEVDTNGFIALYDNGYPKEIGYDIEYAIAFRQNLSVNLEANDVFDMDIYQDMSDMISAVDSSIKAHDKVTEIENMMKMEMYQGTYTDTSVTPPVERNYQDTLTQWKAQAQKEADYYDDNLQKLFSRYIGKADDYLEEMSLALTKVGCKADQLAMTQDRMNDQQETVQELQSRNDDMNLSDIILKYTAAYTAYQSSLTAAGKLGSVSLLNYI